MHQAIRESPTKNVNLNVFPRRCRSDCLWSLMTLSKRQNVVIFETIYWKISQTSMALSLRPSIFQQCFIV